MEKQTKILLGVGAVIAAYLILKPKKATAQTSVVNTSNTKVFQKNGGLDLYMRRGDPIVICDDFSPYQRTNGRIIGCSDSKKFPSFNSNNLVNISNNLWYDNTTGRQYLKRYVEFGHIYVDVVTKVDFPYEFYGQYNSKGELIGTENSQERYQNEFK